LEIELCDRFGALPPAAEALVAAARISLLARAARIARIDAGPAAIAFTPRSDAVVDFAALDFVNKKGRWLHQHRTDDASRASRVTELLAALLEGGS